jgi:hypothetical protein
MIIASSPQKGRFAASSVMPSDWRQPAFGTINEDISSWTVYRKSDTLAGADREKIGARLVDGVPRVCKSAVYGWTNRAGAIVV